MHHIASVRRTGVLLFLSFGLGAVFLVAGLGKLFMLNEFSATISNIAHLSLRSASVLAVGVIAFEVLGGICLLVGLQTRILSMLFCVLVAVFMWILSAAVAEGKEIACNCFGIVGLRLSNANELILDLVLLNAFAVLAFAGGTKTGIAESPVRAHLKTFATVACIILLEAFLVVPLLTRSAPSESVNVHAALALAESARPQFGTIHGGNRLVLLMQYSDLSCSLCLDDFILFTDSLDSQSGIDKANRVVAVFREDRFSLRDSSGHLLRWATANNLNLPIALVPDSMFSKTNIRKSTAIIVNADGEVLFEEQFPMGSMKRNLALEILSNKLLAEHRTMWR